MRSLERLWLLTDALSLLGLRVRGALLLFGGRLLGDEFMMLAGRFDLKASHRRPVARTPLRRIHTR